MPPKHTAISLETKYNALIEISAKSSTAIETAVRLKIAKNTVYDWIRAKDKIIEQYKASSQHGPIRK